MTFSTLDSLSNIYSKIEARKIQAKQYVPNLFYFGKDKSTLKLYMIKTLYRIDENKLTILYQVKVRFYERPGHKLPGVESIELPSPDKARTFDPQIVLKSRQQALENDKNETSPSIEHL